MSLVAAAALLTSVPAWAQSHDGVEKIAPQRSTPVRINSYGSFYEAETDEHLRHTVQFTNVGKKDLAAVEFCFVEFSAFNDYIGRYYGVATIDLRPGAETLETFIHELRKNAASFRTGVAYVSQVRFSDGTVWKASVAEVLPALKKIDSGFSSTALRKKVDEQ